MENKKQLLKKIFFILIALTLLVGISYAFIYFGFTGRETNLINAGCLKLELTEETPLTLSNSIALTDEQGSQLNPYVYTITNTCTTEAYFETTFNVLNTSGVGNEAKTKISIIGDTYLAPTLLSDFEIVTLTDKPNDINTSYLIDSGYIKPNEILKFDLRMWIDYDATDFNGSLNGKIIIDAIAQKGPNFKSYTIGYKVLKNNILETNANYSTIAPSTGEIPQNSGLYLENEGMKYAYYYRGNVQNNYIKFGKYQETETVTYLDSAGVSQTITHNAGDDMIWRIVKINEDGSLKIILDDVIGMAAFNSTNNDSKYIGYVYDDSTNSTIKEILDNWYAKHLTNYDQYIIPTFYCSDSSNTITNEITYFGGYTRNITNHNPSNICEEQDATISKIALLTVDELAKAGAMINVPNNNFYLNIDLNGWWTMSPAKYENGVAYNFASLADKSMSVENVIENHSIRPVINLNVKSIITSVGTRSNPYYVTDTMTISTESTIFQVPGAPQLFTVTKDGYYQIELWGAQGGSYINAGIGGKGGYTKGTIYLEENEILYVYVGGEGPANQTLYNVGGWNGGGYSGGNGYYNGGGGGATDIRCFSENGKCIANTSNLVWNNNIGLNSRIMVAGGGGSLNSSYILPEPYGYGGGLVGGAGTTDMSSYDNTTYLPTGGSQVSHGYSYAGTGGFGYAIQSNSGGTGGGGGSGYYGGGLGYGTSGSGGSSFISGYQGCIAIESSALTNNPRTVRKDSNGVNCTEESAANDIICSHHYSGKIFEDTIMRNGNQFMPTHDGLGTMVGNQEDGYAKITWLGKYLN